MREDLSLLIYSYLERYRRGDYDPLLGEIRAVTAEWLYFAAGRRWQRNLDELEESVLDACREAARTGGTVSCLRPGDDAPERGWLQDCPFALSWPGYALAVHRSERHSEVAIDDLPGYDIRALMEAADEAAKPADRGRWTFEARRRRLENQRPDAPVGTQEDRPVPAVGTEQGVREEKNPPTHTSRLRIDRDEDGNWTCGVGDILCTVKKDLVGFLYWQVLCNNPARQYSPTELRNSVFPDRDAIPATDRKAVTRECATAKKSLPSLPNELELHLIQYMRIGKICQYDPPRLSPE